MTIEACVEEVLMVFQGCFKEVQRVQEVSKVFQETFIDFWEVSRVDQRSLEGKSRRLQRCFKEVSRVF